MILILRISHVDIKVYVGLFYAGFATLAITTIRCCFQPPVFGSENRRRNVVFAVQLMVLTFLTSANLLVYVGFSIAERVLYLPSLGNSLNSTSTRGLSYTLDLHLQVSAL